MTDFLTRLAARTLGVGQTVTPLQAPKLAAPADASDLWPDLDDATEANPIDPSHIAPTKASSAQLPSLPSAPDAGRTASPGRSGRAYDRAPSQVDLPRSPQAAVPVPAQSTIDASPREADPTATRSEEPAPAHRRRGASPAAPVVRHDEPDQPAPLVAASSLPPGPAGFADLNDAAPGTAPREFVLDEGSSARRDAAATFTPMVRTAGLLRLGPSFPPTPPTAVAPAPGPTVRITIGRVEVRAVPPPPAPEPAAPRRPEEAPRLSLSDYLKRGGSR